MTKHTIDIPKQNCANCVFSLPKHEQDVNGDLFFLCRRNPPSIVHGETGMILQHSAWPTVRHSAWCGEWDNEQN